MKYLAPALLLVALAACEDRRSFDERYNDTSRELQNRAERLEQNLAQPAPQEANAVQNLN